MTEFKRPIQGREVWVRALETPEDCGTFESPAWVGPDVKDNLQAAHARCNSIKSNKTEDELSD